MKRDVTVFSTQQQPQNIQQSNNLTLTKKAYQEIIKEAYEAGKKDAYKIDTDNVASKWEKDIKKEGKAEALREEAKRKEAYKQRTQNITARRDMELLRTRSTFPFVLFPDTLIIDTTKVTIMKKQLFATEYVTTIPLKDISDATIQTALFLASLTVSYMPQTSNPGMTRPVDVRILSLKREDAIKAKNILKGVVVARAENIDIANLSPQEVADILQKFGESKGAI